MTHRISSLMILNTVLGATLLVPVAATGQAVAAQDDPPRILFTQSPRAIEYQLGRLTNDQLVRVDRKEDDLKYRLVYYALLTRRGLGREYFDEALGALTKMDR